MSHISPFTTLGAKGGAATHTLTINEMPAHSHSLRRGETGNARVEEIAYSSGSNTQTTPAAVNNTGGGAAHNNMSPYIVVNYEVIAG